VPGTVTCGVQRVPANSAPAIAPDGTLYIVTVAHLWDRESYLVAVKPDLTPGAALPCPPAPLATHPSRVLQCVAMTREQYEEQKRRLAEQHRSLVEMVDSAYQTQLRALDMVWRMMSGEGATDPRPAPAPAAAPPRASAPAPPARRRRRAGELYEEVRATIAHLPDLFTFSDVCRALGYNPDRGSLYRALQDLQDLGAIALHSRGTGTRPTRYRNLVPREPEPGA